MFTYYFSGLGIFASHLEEGQETEAPEQSFASWIAQEQYLAKNKGL